MNQPINSHDSIQTLTDLTKTFTEEAERQEAKLKTIPRSPKPKTKRKKAKPYAPLYLHGNGQFAKKIRGRTHYFGTDWKAAVDKYLRERDDLLAGRRPKEETGDLTLKHLANEFLIAKKQKLLAKEMTARCFHDYYKTLGRMLDVLGKNTLITDLRPKDFATLRSSFAAKYSPHRIKAEIGNVRCLFKWGFENGFLVQPMQFGTDFKKPDKRKMRQHRRESGKKLFTLEETHRILAKAPLQLRTMCMLGLNAGLGNHDCGLLSLEHLDLDAGFLDYPRPKTEIGRRSRLWPETIQLIREVLASRPEPKDEADRDKIFITRQGNPWSRESELLTRDDGTPTVTNYSPISIEFKKLLTRLGINGGRRNFYCLRHMTETIGGQALDQPALNIVMGHADSSISDEYREEVGDDRLEKVAAVIHDWLFGKETEAPVTLPFARAE